MNNFNLSHEVLTSGRIGNLIPVQCELAVPGQFKHQRADFLMRFAPLAQAAMVRMNVHFHTFFVPLRLCTPRNAEECGFNEFMLKIRESSENIPILPRLVCPDATTIDNSDSKIDYNQVSLHEVKIGSLWDYMKLPTYNLPVSSVERTETDLNPKMWPTKGISLMPFYAYQRIFDDWYRRDQIEKRLLLPRDCHEVAVGDFDSGDFVLPDDWQDTSVYADVTENMRYDQAKRLAIHNLFTLRQRNYERDYFTASLPEPQFGDEVYIQGIEQQFESLFTGQLQMTDVELISSSRTSASIASNLTFSAGESVVHYAGNGEQSTYFDLTGRGDFRMQGDMSKFFPQLTVNQLRVAFQMQGVAEKLNRGGTRFKEFSNIIYHIDIPDARLQRVEYVGGFKAPVTIGTVVQTSASSEDGNPLGTLAGKATSAGSDVLSKGKKLIFEHGYYITLMSVTPRTSYYGGIPRLFSLTDPIDFYLPDFDRLGEDAVYNRELYCDLWNNSGQSDDYEPEFGDGPDEIFGYDPMYSYLTSSTSTVTGEFRTTLADFHLSRSFNRTPNLSPEFIKCMPEDFDRIFDFQNIDGTSNEHFYTEIVLTNIDKKPMSKYSTPLTLM